MTAEEFANSFLMLSEQEKLLVATTLEDHLHGSYFPQSDTGENLDVKFILAALNEWATDFGGES